MEHNKVLYCRLCKANTDHDYLGKQPIDEISYMDLYNCNICNNTRADNTTKDITDKLESKDI